MALSKDNQYLAIGTPNGFQLLDLNTLVGTSHNVNFNTPSGNIGGVRSFAFDHTGRIYLTNLKQDFVLTDDTLIHYYDPATNSLLNTFGLGPNMEDTVHSALLKTDQTGALLYVGERELNDITLAKIDIIDPANPEILVENIGNNLGQYLYDYAISHRFDELYLVGGHPRRVQIVDSNTLNQIGGIWTNNKVIRDVTLDQSGLVLYSLANVFSNPNQILALHAQLRYTIATMDLISNFNNSEVSIRGLVLDRFGEKGYVLHEFSEETSTFTADATTAVQVVNIPEEVTTF